MMKFKALIFDIDGTAIPNRPGGVPSERLIKLIKRLQPNLKISAATGRIYSTAMPVIKKLGLMQPCIIAGGTRIIDPKTDKILWKKDMSSYQVKLVVDAVADHPYELYSDTLFNGTLPRDVQDVSAESIIFIVDVPPSETEKIQQDLKSIPEIVTHTVRSWTPGLFDIHVTHHEATKRHALEILLDIEKIHKSEVIAAGDSGNDIPLFEAAGYKIAMGNGSDELKQKADIIAPNAEDDGLAGVLEQIFKELD